MSQPAAARTRATTAKTAALAATAALLVAAGPPAAHAATPPNAGTKKMARQIKKLRTDVRKLKVQIASASVQQGPVGPAGPAGPQGPTGEPGIAGAAGGDLTGTYPDPQIKSQAVGATELAWNAIGHDTSAINTALGNFTTKVGPGAIGREEIADGQVDAKELGSVTAASNYIYVPPGEHREVDAKCDPGQQVLSGGGYWTSTELYQYPPKRALVNSYPETSADWQATGWSVDGYNASGDDTTLVVRVVCLG
jgi:hypothetical protein